jgi:hypothetical protein
MVMSPMGLGTKNYIAGEGERQFSTPFPTWWVASRFVVAREKFLKFVFNYIKIKNHKEWESEKTNKIIIV